jgi:hypothetical protein
MARGLLFGRRIRVTMGNVIVADIDPAQPEASQRHSLDVSFTTEAHTKLSPLSTHVTVIGLNRETRARLSAQQKAAASVAWDQYQKVLTGAIQVTEEEQILQAQQQLSFQGLQVRIEAGYQDDFALIADAQSLPDGIKHDVSGVPTTTIEAQDGRYPWQNGFVSEEMSTTGVTYRDWQLVLQISEGYQTGTITGEEVDAAIPGLLTRKNFGGYLNGRVLTGDAALREQEMAETLGLMPFFDRGQKIYLNLNAVTQAEAVVLRLVGAPRSTTPTPGGLLSYTEPDDRGFVQVHTLLNHRLSPGRQVQVFDADGVPVGAGVFRCEYVKHSGSTFDATYNSDAVLRPVTIKVADNV